MDFSRHFSFVIGHFLIISREKVGLITYESTFTTIPNEQCLVTVGALILQTAFLSQLSNPIATVVLSRLLNLFFPYQLITTQGDFYEIFDA